MRISILIAGLLIALTISACAAPSQPPPWRAADRQLIDESPDQKYYFLRSSVRFYDEGIIVDTITEYPPTGRASEPRYCVETVWIAFEQRLKTISAQTYDEKGSPLLTVPPDSDWQNPNPLIHRGLLPVIYNYCFNDLGPSRIKNWPVKDASWYTKAITGRSGDTYYFHGGRIESLADSIAVFIRIDYQQEKNDAKYWLTQARVNPHTNTYRLEEGYTYDTDGKRLKVVLPNPADIWYPIVPHTEMGDFLLQVLEYCRKGYIGSKVNFTQAVPKCIPFTAAEREAFFNPASIVVRDGCLWVEMISQTESGCFTSLEVLRLRDKNINSTGYRTYDAAGNENSARSHGLQDWKWQALKTGSKEADLFAAVFEYCRANDISLN